MDRSILDTQASATGPSSTSSSLLRRVKQQDPDAWRRLVKLYGPLVYLWSRKAGLQPDDAADVIQEVFAAVVGGVGTFRRERPGDSFRGWLWTITRNKIRDHFLTLTHLSGDGTWNDALELEFVPEPSTTVSLVALGGLCLAACWRRRGRHNGFKG